MQLARCLLLNANQCFLYVNPLAVSRVVILLHSLFLRVSTLYVHNWLFSSFVNFPTVSLSRCATVFISFRSKGRSCLFIFFVPYAFQFLSSQICYPLFQMFCLCRFLYWNRLVVRNFLQHLLHRGPLKTTPGVGQPCNRAGVPKVGVPAPWGRWETPGGGEAEMGGWGTIGDPVNNYVSVVLLTLSDQMS